MGINSLQNNNEGGSQELLEKFTAEEKAQFDAIIDGNQNESTKGLVRAGSHLFLTATDNLHV